MCDLRPSAKLRQPYQAGDSRGLEVTSQELHQDRTFLWARLMLYCMKPKDVIISIVTREFKKLLLYYYFYTGVKMSPEVCHT